MPVLELRRKSRLDPRSLVLQPYRRNVTSQFGEDGMIEHLFEVIGTTNRWCAEMGAWDGRKYSNTWNLIEHHGWDGVLIEGERERFLELERTYEARRQKTRLINAFVGLEAGFRLDDLLTRAGAPADLDLLCIDIDGNDWHIWNSLSAYRPRVVLIECNPSVDNDIYFVQDYGAHVNHGSSMLAMVELAKEKGYELVASTGVNAFFVMHELFPALAIADNSIDALHEAPDHMIKIFQGYDGTIFAAGHLQLYWHGRNLSPEDFQVLPPLERRFPGTPRRRWWRRMRDRGRARQTA